MDEIVKWRDRVKYPRTYHLPTSPGATKDDKIIHDIDILKYDNVIVTLKLDGENTTMYSDYIHSRSIDSRSHSSQNWVRNFHAKIKYLIPDDWRVCGENMYAKHSIEYEDLETYFYGFSVWDNMICLDWESTIEQFNALGIHPVSVIYKGVFDLELIQHIFDNTPGNHEGYVIRIAKSFHYSEYNNRVVKWVRKNHVQTDVHWKEEWTKNKLRNE